MKWARATDANQEQLVRQLRQLGVWVWPTHRLGAGFPDLLCCAYTTRRFVLLEVKDGAKKPSARRLTPAEAAFHGGCPGPVHVVETLDEALAVLFPGARGNRR